MNGRTLFARFSPLINMSASVLRLLPLSIRKKMFAQKRYSKGLYGIGVRYILLKSIANNVGNNVCIDEGCHILNPEKLSIGDNVSINAMCYIECWGGVEIGSDVSIAHNTTVMSVTHNYDDLANPIKYQGLTALPVKINDNVWIGAKSTILGGTTVDSGAIIGANALVKTHVPPNSVVAGVPARIIKYRNRD